MDQATAMNMEKRLQSEVNKLKEIFVDSCGQLEDLWGTLGLHEFKIAVRSALHQCGTTRAAPVHAQSDPCKEHPKIKLLTELFEAQPESPQQQQQQQPVITLEQLAGN